MNLIADTNLLVRMIVGDDQHQAEAALHLLERAQIVILPTAALCELCWVLGRTYKLTAAQLEAAIRDLVFAANAVVDDRAVGAGLVVLANGGDFADGAIAASGLGQGGEQFVTFDRQAAKLVADAGIPTRLLD
ncbi:MAG: type II toxin-antitoxin system VapC family toxin [Micrococcales bacterium]|nr:type II toxin-antitoxin system VapC family toxin [Micrococcales bacterium]